MILETPRGTEWHITDAAEKIALRAGLPGAFVYDRAAHSLRIAKASGMSARERLPLALPASWLVNSPAISKVLRRWALPPDCDVWAKMIDALDGGPHAWCEKATLRSETATMLGSLGSEPYLTEAVSKVLALVVPELVPLMPKAARTFVLGSDRADEEGALVAMIDWFAPMVIAHQSDLDTLAQHHAVPLVGAQVLDRLLWFDSEGHRHFQDRTSV